jgi:lipopolysaccharide biosynthesis regulator YciM
MNLPNYYYYLFAALAIIVLVAIAAFVFRKSNKRSSLLDPYIEGLKRLIAGDNNGAFLFLEKAVKRGNAPTYAYIKLGELLRDRGEAGKALQIHQSLTVRENLTKNDRMELHLNIAEDYSMLGRPEQAVSILESALKKYNIKEPQIFASLAKQHNTLGQRNSAFDRLKDLKRSGGIGDRELALFLATAAESASENGDTREAKKLLQRALKLDPSCPAALLKLGDTEEKEGKFDEAIRLWKQAAVVSQELSSAALHHLEKTLFQRGKFGEIEQVYRDILVERNDDESAVLSLASFYRKQGREEEALTLLEEYLASHPDSLGGSLLLSSLYSNLRDSETLETFLDESINRLTFQQRYVCSACGCPAERMRWHCPKCNAFDTFSSDHAT